MRKDLKKVCKLYKEKEGNKVTVADCPVGLFVHDGVLAVKTNQLILGEPDCIDVESGERFCDSQLMVTPLIVGYGLKRTTSEPKELAVEDASEEPAE